MLDRQKILEIEAWAASLELEPSGFDTYSKLAVLKALALFQELEEAGGIQEVIKKPETVRQTEPVQRGRSSAVETYSNSEFLLAVSGKDSAEAWAIMDSHMNALKKSNIKAYESIMRKIREL